MKGKVLLSALLALAVSALAVTPAMATRVAASVPGFTTPLRYYLALGDSLSVGIQPIPSGASVETNQGYVNDLYAVEKKAIHGLKLVQLGCPGESTSSMLDGKTNLVHAKQYHCVKTGGSQLKAAVKWLKAHHAKGEVPLITIDLGANDVDGCTAPGVSLGPCLNAGIASISKNTPKILSALRKAAPKGTTFAGTTIYDPFLAAYLDPYNRFYSLAEPSVALAQQVNTAITTADTGAKFKTADVFDAFKTTVTDPVPGTNIPTNVAEICALTWECTAPPQGPNIHANPKGYSVIAAAFEKVIGKLK